MRARIHQLGFRASGGRQSADSAVALLCSIILHALMLLPILLMLDRAAATVVIPVDVVLLADQAADASRPEPAALPEKEGPATSTPATVPLGTMRSEARPDELELKLQRLARLRQPDTDSSGSDAKPPRVAAMNGNGGPDPYSVSDFIRAQVERRWSLDFAPPLKKAYPVQIRVEITSAGVVTKAEVIRDPRFAAEQGYQDAARSARNAVLLSSPFALPSGHLGETMELTLHLNTQDVLR
jgi:hypothetical protein